MHSMTALPGHLLALGSKFGVRLGASPSAGRIARTLCLGAVALAAVRAFGLG